MREKKIKKFGHEDLQSILSGRKVNSYFSHYLAWPLSFKFKFKFKYKFFFDIGRGSKRVNFK